MPDIRFITKEEIPEFRQAISAGFGFDAKNDDEELQRFLAVFPLETCLAAFEDGYVVATFASFDLELTVPGGGVLPMAGTTVVTVHPAYRRRGLLRQMMRVHLDQAVERGQPLAGLWASEVQIYGRFGYGIAAESYELEVDAATVAAPPGPGDVAVRPIPQDKAASVLPDVYATVCAATPGHYRRTPEWWKARNLHDPESWRGGATAKRTVVAERAGSPVGYVVYRQKMSWEGFVADGSVEVIELVAVDDGVRRTLWHYLLNLDLFKKVKYWNTPIDDPIVDEIDNHRALALKPYDTLWIRVLDVRRALAARSYEADGEICIELDDGFGDAGGTYLLTVEDGRGVCIATDETAELQMDVSVLGSVYLGGVGAWRHKRAGRIAGADDAVRRFDRMFRTMDGPNCLEIF